MRKRVQLQSKLEDILGSNHVYFDPPATIKMSYPAIVYSLEGINNTAADNFNYKYDHEYMVTYISKNPDDEMVDIIAQLPTCNFSRHYVADNLHHWAFTLYYN